MLSGFLHLQVHHPGPIGLSENAKVTPSSLPANRSTPRSHLVVPLPPVGSSRQTIRGLTPKGQALIRNRSIRQRSVPEPDSTTGSRGNPGPPCLPDARRLRSDPIDLALRVRSHRRSTPSPVGVGVTGSDPVPVGSSVRMVRRFARRHSVVPPGLDTRVPVAEPLVPRGASVVAVLPEHALGAFPGSRPSALDQGLGPSSGWLIGSPVQDPLAVFGVEAWCTYDGPESTGGGVFPSSGGDFPSKSIGLHSLVHRSI